MGRGPHDIRVADHADRRPRVAHRDGRHAAERSAVLPPAEEEDDVQLREPHRFHGDRAEAEGEERDRRGGQEGDHRPHPRRVVHVEVAD